MLDGHLLLVTALKAALARGCGWALALEAQWAYRLWAVG